MKTHGVPTSISDFVHLLLSNTVGGDLQQRANGELLNLFIRHQTLWPGRTSGHQTVSGTQESYCECDLLAPVCLWSVRVDLNKEIKAKSTLLVLFGPKQTTCRCRVHTQTRKKFSFSAPESFEVESVMIRQISVASAKVCLTRRGASRCRLHN